MAFTFQRMRKENYEIILNGFVQQGKSWLIFHVGCQVHQTWGGGEDDFTLTFLPTYMFKL